MIRSVSTAVLLSSLGMTQLSDRPQVFRSTGNAVLVDVSVTRKGRTVSGLQTADFVVLDRGVRQSVTLIETRKMPLDISLLVDASFSIDSGPAGGMPLASRHLRAGAWIRSGITTVGSLLGESDRLQVIKFGTTAREVLSSARVLDLNPPGHGATSRRTALFDALLLSVMAPSPPSRRKIIVALTDGLDTASAVDEPVRSRVLDRSEAPVFLIACGSRSFAVRAKGNSDSNFPVTATGTGGNWRMPYGGYDWVLEDISKRTGGQFYTSNTSDDFIRSLQEAFTSFRSRYVLAYEPRGVDPTGWHPLTVSVPSLPDAEVRGRRGYFSGGKSETR